MRSNAHIVLATALLGVALASSATAVAQRVQVRAEGIAAVVGGAAPGPGIDTLFRSDVEFRARMHLAEQASLDEALRAPLPNPLMRASLDELIGEVLIAREATRVRLQPPTPQAITRERLAMERACGGTDALSELARTYGLSDEAIQALAVRRALVSAFLAANLEGATQVSDAEVERVYQSRENPFPNQPLEEVREALRAQLARQALERTVQRWVGVLRARTTMRVLSNYDS